jgi:hypothetical protein
MGGSIMSLLGTEPLQINEKTSIKYKRQTLIILSSRLLQQLRVGSSYRQSYKMAEVSGRYASVGIAVSTFAANGDSVKLANSTVYFILF